MTKYVLSLMIFFLGFSSYAADQYEIASVIKKLHPRLYAKDILLYATIIHKYSNEYNVEWEVAVAIFSQESSFNPEAVNWASHDYGIGQMNRFNIVKRKIKLGKLLTDVDYAIHESFKLLYELKTRYNTGARGWYRWFTRYHSFTPSRRRIYNKYLDKKLKKIKRFLDEHKEEKRISRHTRRKIGDHAPKEEQRNRSLYIQSHWNISPSSSKSYCGP